MSQQFDSQFEERQFKVEGRLINGEAFLQIDMPTGGWITLEDAQYIVNMIQAAIDAGKQEIEQAGDYNEYNEPSRFPFVNQDDPNKPGIDDQY